MRQSRIKWNIIVFLAPAVLVYVGLKNFRTLFGDDHWSDSFWNALGNIFWFFFVHMIVQTPLASYWPRSCPTHAYASTPSTGPLFSSPLSSALSS